MSRYSHDARQKILDHNWYLFGVRTNYERPVCRRLEEAGFTAAVPEVIRMIRRRNRKAREQRTYPALKSYVLVGFLRGEPVPFRRVLDMPFVRGVVGFDTFAARLSSQQVYDFLSNPRWDKRSVDSLIKDFEPDYTVNDIVRLEGAGFDGVRGRVVRMDTRRASVVVPFLGAEREIEVPVECAWKAA